MANFDVRSHYVMAPLSTSAVEVGSKTKGLTIGEWVLRETRDEGEESATWKFQVLLRNESRVCFENLECELRYFDMTGKFIGVDQELPWFAEMKPEEDKTVSISLSVPTGTAKAVFKAKAKRISFAQKHSSLLFIAGMVILVLLSICGEYLWKWVVGK